MKKQFNKDLLSMFQPWVPQDIRFALVKYGGGIVQMSGSIAGNTFARNRFGNYTRARTKPVNPKSARQVGARVAIMYLAEQWREDPMTDVIRTAWQTYANSVNWNNKLGETVTLTGFNMFIRANAALLRLGGTVVTAGPTDLGLPAGDPNMVVSACSAAAQTFTLTFDDTMDWCEEVGAYLSLDQGEPQNPTRNFFGGPWRGCAYLSGFATPGVVSPSVGIVDIGYTFVEGQKIWWRGQIIRADGRVSTKFECEPVIVVA